MKNPLGRIAALAVASTLSLAAGTALADYPERPITLIVPWGAGGGTDATGRMIASLLEKELGQPVNVVNRTGGSGVVGHSAIATAAPDGYTIGVLTVEIGMMHWAGLTELTGADYTPIALYNYDPAGLQVRADSEWQTAQDVLDAVAAAPGEHMAAGGVDIVPCSVVEATALMDAGKVRSLAVMDSERLAAFPDVPTLKEATGLDWEMAAWRGIGGPKGMPDDVTSTLTAALEKAYNSAEFQDFMESRGFGLIWAPNEEFAQWMADSDESLGKVMSAVGLAK
jgi:tripartite-type tricarboxylate transporter receptor subunit TctC